MGVFGPPDGFYCIYQVYVMTGFSTVSKGPPSFDVPSVLSDFVSCAPTLPMGLSFDC